jgi:hypothetical protein
VFAGLPEGARLFPLCSLVVLFSVVIHGGSLMLFGWKAGAPPGPPPEPLEPSEPAPPPAPRKASLPVLAPETPAHALVQIGIEELKALQAAGEPVIILDVRKQRSFEESTTTAAGAARIDPERVVKEAERLRLPREAWLVAFCA